MAEAVLKLQRAIIRLGPTRAARAKALGLSTKALAAWEDGRIPGIITKLESLGVIRIVEDPKPLDRQEEVH